MKGRKLAIALMVFTAIGIFGFVPYLRAQTDQKVMEGRKAIVEGAKQMMHGTKKIMAVLEKKKLMDEETRAADKQMKVGYGLIMKGSGMMAGSTIAKGQEMMKHGAAMMLRANTAMMAAAEKKGLTEICAIDFHECHYAEQKIEHGALMWYFGAAGY